MGLSASQIRYCMLQARKSDVEYQGQQINQQRTTLATQSSAYNTELLTLTVPTPPSSEEYTINSYNFVQNGEDCSIKGTNYMSKEYTADGETYPAGTYVIDYTRVEIQDVGVRGSRYTVTKTTQSGVDTYSVIANSKSFTLKKVDNDGTSVEDVIHQSNVNQIRESFGISEEDETTFYYAEISSGNYAYFTKTELQENKAQAYKVESKSVDVADKMYGATINWTDTGRMSSITDAKGHIISLNVTTSADDEGYAEAYNEYLYQKDQYNKAIDDINAQLEVIQSQDKKLELQLTNLDTQERAINAELDAVKNVTKGNIEKTFNIFS